jgi:nicotinamide mononucleotide (NMN) deamidase PncC
MEDTIQAIVAGIHAAPPRLVLAFAGAGSLALWQLHRVAGSSRTLLEAIDCYAPRSLAALLGAAPAQAVSAATARGMAEAAYARAADLAEGDWPLLGVGCTAAVVTDRERRGADRCALAIRSAGGVTHYTLTMSRGRGRAGQEELVARLLIGALARACGVAGELPLGLLPGEDLGSGT